MALNKELIADLRQVPLFSNWTDEHLLCLESGEEICLKANEPLVVEGQAADHFYILLEGELLITKSIDGVEMVINTYLSGTYFGEVPILLDKPYIASCHTVQPSRLFRLNADDFWNMLGRCHAVNRQVLRTMARRVMDLQVISAQHQKLAALGALASGLAHELNNPAAAVASSATQLRAILSGLSGYAFRLCAQPMSAENWNLVTGLPGEALHRPEVAPALDPLQRSEREESLTFWLEAHDFTEAWRLAPTLAVAGWDQGQLDALAEQIPAGSLVDVLSWLSAEIGGAELLTQIDQGAARISSLIQAIKDYSYMDQAPLQVIDLQEGLENTLIMLSYKLKRGNVVVTREYDPDLPRLNVYGSALNQVWTHLIDNALDALNGSGNLRLRTAREAEWALVEIADDGPGIPLDQQARVYEPFFTTKTSGLGRGLGLDISRRIVADLHRGDIRFTSRPGATCFQVRLPLNLETDVTV